MAEDGSGLRAADADAPVIPSHANDLGDWCPWSLCTTTASATTCPQMCREASAKMGGPLDVSTVTLAGSLGPVTEPQAPLSLADEAHQVAAFPQFLARTEPGLPAQRPDPRGVRRGQRRPAQLNRGHPVGY